MESSTEELVFVIPTSYYQIRPFDSDMGEVPIEKTFNTYDPYLRFSLSKYMDLWCIKELGPEIDLRWDIMNMGRKSVLVMTFYRNGLMVGITPDQAKEALQQLDFYHPYNKWTLVLDSDMYSRNKLWDVEWVRSMINLIQLDADYEMLISDDQIYASLDRENFQEEYGLVISTIREQLEELYKLGVCRIPHSKNGIIEKWGLVLYSQPVEDQYYYHCDYCPGYDFIHRLIYSEPIIKFDLLDNYVVKHFVSQELRKIKKEFTLDNRSVSLMVEDKKEYEHIKRLIDITSINSLGKCAVVRVANLSKLDLIPKEFGDKISWWKTANIVKPFFVSFWSDDSLDHVTMEEWLEEFFN